MVDLRIDACPVRPSLTRAESAIRRCGILPSDYAPQSRLITIRRCRAADLDVGRGLPARGQQCAERFICEYHRDPVWLGKLSAGSCSAYWNGESPAWFP
jgi:hypothetical protein